MENTEGGFPWSEAASGPAEGNTARGNADGFWVADTAAPTLIRNISRGHHNDDSIGSGLIYSGTLGGVARRNQICDNDWGIARSADANPQLVNNDVHDNTRNQVTGVNFN